MHPEMIRAIAAQQATDRLAEARAWRRATVARQARKARRHGHDGPDPLAGVRIPDYVDATFEARPAGHAAAGGQLPGGHAGGGQLAGGHAAGGTAAGGTAAGGTAAGGTAARRDAA